MNGTSEEHGGQPRVVPRMLARLQDDQARLPDTIEGSGDQEVQRVLRSHVREPRIDLLEAPEARLALRLLVVQLQDMFSKQKEAESERRHYEYMETGHYCGSLYD